MQGKFSITLSSMNLPSIDQDIFTCPLSLILGANMRAKKHWLTIAHKYYATTQTQKTGQQPKLTAFLQRKVHTDSKWMQLIDNLTTEEMLSNGEIFTLANKLQEEYWRELWEIIHGTTNNDYESFDGTNILRWWS
jgi:hypothetical protein